MMMMLMEFRRCRGADWCISILLLLLWTSVLLSRAVVATTPVTLTTSTTKGRFQFVARHYFPAGYQAGTTQGVPDQYGFGFGALERSYYDAEQKLFYGASELGFVSISDFATYPTNVTTLNISFALTESMTDIKICGDYLFYTTKHDPDPGTLHVYRKAVRRAIEKNDDGPPQFITAPRLLYEIPVGVGPDNIAVSKDCAVVATANEGEGDYSSETGLLIDPVGSVSIVRGPFNDDGAAAPRHTLVALDRWTEAELISKGVHLPLSRNAMQYWNATLDQVNFDLAINAYTPDMMLEPEYVVFSHDETQIFVNLQENNALVTIDVVTNTATDIYSYGLKSGYPVDIIADDGGCGHMPTTPTGLAFLRSVDGLASFMANGVQYIVTANEGDDVAYWDFAEKVHAGDIFNGTVIAFVGMTAALSVFDPTDPTAGSSAPFNGECNNNSATVPFCAPGLALTLGTSTVDYSDPTRPNIYQLTGIGGRGLSIYKIDVKADGGGGRGRGLELVWDSGALLEMEGCRAFPWAHNAEMDEEYAPADGAFFNSLAADDVLREDIIAKNDPTEDGCADGGNGRPGACPLGASVDARSNGDGCAPETVVVGTACGGELYMATACEKNSIAFVFKLTDPSAPELYDVFHLSPASERLNPGLAYASRTLGEIDAESIQFLSSDHSPTGKAAILFAGAFSGTTSLWEFVCPNDKGDDEKDDSPAELVLAVKARPQRLIAFAAATVGLLLVLVYSVMPSTPS